MKEQLISFETAKLAKEKRFYAWCIKMYSKDGTIKRHGRPDKANRNPNLYLAPTKSLLQKWLREEYDIHIAINTYWFPSDTYKGYYPEIENIKTHEGHYSASDRANNNEFGFESYEEALEFGLQEALKLIKK